MSQETPSRSKLLSGEGFEITEISVEKSGSEVEAAYESQPSKYQLEELHEQLAQAVTST